VLETAAENPGRERKRDGQTVGHANDGVANGFRRHEVLLDVKNCGHVHFLVRIVDLSQSVGVGRRYRCLET